MMFMLFSKRLRRQTILRLAGTETTRLQKKGVSKEIEFDEFKMILYVREPDGEFKYLIRGS